MGVTLSCKTLLYTWVHPGYIIGLPGVYVWCTLGIYRVLWLPVGWLTAG